MNILFVTGHPAQIHGFRNLKFELEKKGHKVFWLATNKEISNYLLDYYNIEYNSLIRPRNYFISNFFTFSINILISVRYLRKRKIDIVFSRISPYMCVACFILRKVHLGLTDTESAGFYDKFFGRLLSVIFTAESYKITLRSDQIRFNGNIELFYLHPNRFKQLSKEKVDVLLNIKTAEPYVITRFVSWDAYHDRGLSGFSDENKLKAVNLFSNYARVFISSERPLPDSLIKYQIKIPPEKMHDVIAHATLFFGESATMASESAVLGTPAIFLNENWFGSTDEEQENGLLFSYKESLEEQERAIQKGVELLNNTDIKFVMRENRNKFLKKKIDVTAFFVWFIENWPESFRIMKENPDYQYRFL